MEILALYNMNLKETCQENFQELINRMANWHDISLHFLYIDAEVSHYSS